MNQTINTSDKKLAIIGLGYVGFPLAVEFGKKYQTLGFDINSNRISELKSGTDSTLEMSDSELAETTGLTLISPEKNQNDAIILAVAHNEFKEMGVENIRQLGKENHVLYDLKYLLPKESVDMRL